MVNHIVEGRVECTREPEAKLVNGDADGGGGAAEGVGGVQSVGRRLHWRDGDARSAPTSS
jgi:hypothetical protein